MHAVYILRRLRHGAGCHTPARSIGNSHRDVKSNRLLEAADNPVAARPLAPAESAFLLDALLHISSQSNES